MMNTADIIIQNGRIYTVDSKNPWAEAVAVKDGKIQLVGSQEKVMGLAGQDTQIIDAKGRFLLPGFFDNHCHPNCYVYKANGVQVYNCMAHEEYQETVRQYAQAHPELSIIKGSGWFFSDFDENGPTRQILDAAVSDRPVLLYSGDFHNAWVNTKALEEAGIDSSTKDPESGTIVRDEAGNPTGFFNEAPAVSFLESRLSGYSPEDFKDGILTFFKEANQAGITSVRDAGIIHPTAYEAYKMIKEDDLTVRLTMDILVPPEGDEPIEEKLAEATRKMELYRNGMVSTRSVKLFMDGVCESYTGLLEDPYLNDGDNRGEPIWDLYRFNEICQKADAMGYQIHIHTIGDRAVRYALNGLEYAALKNGVRDSRHQLAHVQLLNQDDLTRLEKMKVIVTNTPIWSEKEGLYREVELVNLGGERADREYPMKSLLNRGVKVACGSDCPVGTTPEVIPFPYAPVLSIQQGITRCVATEDPRDMTHVHNPRERASLEEMIRAHTLDSAFACFSDDVTGSIEEGKYADIIMLDQNLFEIPVTEIYKTQVVMTMLGGKIIYQV